MTTRRSFLRRALAAAAAGAWGRARGEPKGANEPPPGIPVNDAQSQLNLTRVSRIVEPDSREAVLDALAEARKEEHAVCIAGARHATGGQQFAADAMLIDTRKLAKVIDFDTGRGLVEVESGIGWPDLLESLLSAQRGAEKAWTFAQKQTGADRLTLGGALAANIHGSGLAMPPFVHDIEAFRLIDARGKELRCSREEQPELFGLAIGGFGLFGFVYSLTLRLVPRRKLQRSVEVRELAGLVEALEQRAGQGFVYGSFQLAIDPASGDFLRKGVLCCHRPVDDATPLPALQRELTQADRRTLLELAHSAKPEYFKRYADAYLATDGQIFWSDELQMSAYPEGYHAALDRKLGSPMRGSEALTEIYCEREALERVMDEVRDYARRYGVNIIGASVRLVEQDSETFLAWARKPYACIGFEIHIDHDTHGMIQAGDTLRRLIDFALQHGGSYAPTYHRYALRRQVLAAFPQLPQFLKLKRKYDRAELFQSEWYRYYKQMLFPER